MTSTFGMRQNSKRSWDISICNRVKRGLVKEPAGWEWSSFWHYSMREVGPVEIEAEWTAQDRELLSSGGPARVFLGPG